MTDHTTMKLGRRGVRRDPRTLQFTKYLTLAVPPAPPLSVDYSGGITDWGMFCNDRLECCTIAAVGHHLQGWRKAACGDDLYIPDSVIEQTYKKWDGYNPADPASDQGGVEIDVLNKYRQQGFAGFSLQAFAKVTLLPTQIREALWLTGGLYIGVALPVAAQHQEVWDYDPAENAGDPDYAPGSWGGHAINLVGYDATGLTAVTWGALKRLTWSWLAAYCDEAYALLSYDWITASGVAPSGFDLDTLERDLALVTA